MVCITSKYHDSDFMSKLEVELSTATSTDKEVIISGDFNCDLLPTRSVNAECKQLKSLLKFMNFNQLIKQPTRINQTTATLLDLIATNGSSISFSGVVGVSLGDHEMVLCTRKVNWRKLKPKTRIFRNYSNYNHVDFCDDLNKIDISVDGLWANFKDIVRQIEADILTISWDNSILVLSCSFKVSKYISECWPR